MKPKKESEWERVLRRIKQDKCLGGHYKHWNRMDDPMFVENRRKYEDGKDL